MVLGLLDFKTEWSDIVVFEVVLHFSLNVTKDPAVLFRVTKEPSVPEVGITLFW